MNNKERFHEAIRQSKNAIEAHEEAIARFRSERTPKNAELCRQAHMRRCQAREEVMKASYVLDIETDFLVERRNAPPGTVSH